MSAWPIPASGAPSPAGSTSTMGRAGLGPIFLSASVPYRQPQLYKLDVVAIKDAIRALVSAVVPTRALVFGGHPAITPMVWEAANGLGAAHNVYIYQSEKYRAQIPPQARFFGNLIWTAGVPKPTHDPADPFDTKASLERMRDEMIGQVMPPNYDPLPPFDAGVFIGGMDGVEIEWDKFVQRHPGTPAFPVVSTEGAAWRIFLDHVRVAQAPRQHLRALQFEQNYRKLFRDVLP